jgi:hypothetical protein
MPLGSSAGVTQSVTAASRPAALSLAQALKAATGAALSRQGTSGSAAPKDVVTESGTIYDGYGGSFTYSMSIDDQTGFFTGSFSFVDYHGDSGEAFSGSVSVSGTFNFNTGTMDSLHFVFTSIVMADGFYDVTVSGSIEMINGNPATATETLFMTDNATGKMAWIENFIVAVTEGAGYIDATMTGNIYLHDYGCVVVSTPIPFRYYTGDTNPSVGTMVVTGASNGRAMISVIDSTSYTIDVDADGDGICELSTPHTWI